MPELSSVKMPKLSSSLKKYSRNPLPALPKTSSKGVQPILPPRLPETSELPRSLKKYSRNPLPAPPKLSSKGVQPTLPPRLSETSELPRSLKKNSLKPLLAPPKTSSKGVQPTLPPRLSKTSKLKSEEQSQVKYRNTKFPPMNTSKDDNVTSGSFDNQAKSSGKAINSIKSQVLFKPKKELHQQQLGPQLKPKAKKDIDENVLTTFIDSTAAGEFLSNTENLEKYAKILTNGNSLERYEARKVLAQNAASTYGLKFDSENKKTYLWPYLKSLKSFEVDDSVLGDGAGVLMLKQSKGKPSIPVAILSPLKDSDVQLKQSWQSVKVKVLTDDDLRSLQAKRNLKELNPGRLELYNLFSGNFDTALGSYGSTLHYRTALKRNIDAARMVTTKQRYDGSYMLDIDANVAALTQSKGISFNLLSEHDNSSKYFLYMNQQDKKGNIISRVPVLKYEMNPNNGVVQNSLLSEQEYSTYVNKFKSEKYLKSLVDFYNEENQPQLLSKMLTALKQSNPFVISKDGDFETVFKLPELREKFSLIDSDTQNSKVIMFNNSSIGRLSIANGVPVVLSEDEYQARESLRKNLDLFEQIAIGRGVPEQIKKQAKVKFIDIILGANLINIKNGKATSNDKSLIDVRSIGLNRYAVSIKAVNGNGFHYLGSISTFYKPDKHYTFKFN